MPVRATVKGWNLPSVAMLTEKKRIRWLSGGRGVRVPQGQIPTPERPQWFNLEVTQVGGQGGEDYFEFEVHTPETLQRALESHGALLGRGIVVVVEEYDPERVAEEMRPFVESVEEGSWEEVAFRVASLGPWEFEGWRWHPEEEELRPDPGVQAEVRGVRLLRTAVGDSFDLPIEVRFGPVGADEEIALQLRLQSPLWVRNHLPPDGILIGSGRIFALRPDTEEIAATLAAASPIATARTWDLLRLSLQPLGAAER